MRWLGNRAVLGGFEILTHRQVRRLWWVAWLRFTSRAMEMVVLSWLVLELTDSASQVALVGISRMTPMLLLGIAAGSLADRYPKPLSMVGAQAAHLVGTLMITTVLSTGTVRPYHVFAYMFVAGASWTVDFSARRSYLSEILPVVDLTRAISLEAVAFFGGTLIGPLLGGSLLPMLDYTGVYGVVLLAQLAGIGLLSPLARERGQPVPVRASGDGSRVIHTIRAMWGYRPIQAVLLVTVTMNLFGFPFDQLVPVIARDTLQVGSALYGALAAAVGLGALIGSVVISAQPIWRPNTLFSLGATLVLVTVFGFSLSPLYWLSLLLLFGTGLAMSGFDATQSTLVLTAAPPQARGTALGVLMLCIGAMPLGMYVLGRLAGAIGSQQSLALMTGTGLLFMGCLFRRYPELLDR